MKAESQSARPTAWRRLLPIAVVFGWMGAVLGGGVGYQRVTEARAVVAHWQRVEGTVLRIVHHTSSGGRHGSTHHHTEVTCGYELNGEALQATCSLGHHPVHVGQREQFYASPLHPRRLESAEATQAAASADPMMQALFGALAGFFCAPVFAGGMYAVTRAAHSRYKKRGKI